MKNWASKVQEANAPHGFHSFVESPASYLGLYYMSSSMGDSERLFPTWDHSGWAQVQWGGRSSLTLWSLKKLLSRKNPKYWQGRKKALWIPFDWLSLWIVMRKCPGGDQEQAQVKRFSFSSAKRFLPWNNSLISSGNYILGKNIK